MPADGKPTKPARWCVGCHHLMGYTGLQSYCENRECNNYGLVAAIVEIEPPKNKEQDQ